MSSDIIDNTATNTLTPLLSFHALSLMKTFFLKDNGYYHQRKPPTAEAQPGILHNCTPLLLQKDIHLRKFTNSLLAAHTEILYTFEIYKCAMKRFEGITGFQWDDGNILKNHVKHGVPNSESEEAFFNQPLIIADDTRHSATEQRYYALGKTDTQRKLFIVFTIRENKVRIISSRDMNQQERTIYEKAEKNST